MSYGNFTDIHNIKLGEIKKNFAINLKNYRKLRKVSQTKIAEIAEVTKQAVSRWEHRHAIPNDETIQKIANFLEVTVNDLTGVSSINDIIAQQHNSYFMLMYSSKGKISSLANFLSQKKEDIIYVPSKFFKLKDSLIAFKLKEETFIPKDAVIIVNQTDKIQNNQLVAILHNNTISVKRYFKENKEILLKEKDDSIFQYDEENVEIIGVVIWYMNPQNIIDNI